MTWDCSGITLSLDYWKGLMKGVWLVNTHSPYQLIL